MRHRVAKRHLGRDTNNRKNLLRGMVRDLVMHAQITTTEAKAKEVKRLADKLIYRAKTDTVASRRQLHSFLGKRDVVNVLVERIAPLFPNRVSGFTTLKRVGLRRGDNTQLVKLELVNKPEITGTLKNPKPVATALKKAETAKQAASKKAAVKAEKKAPAKKTAAKRTATKTTTKKTTPKKKADK